MNGISYFARMPLGALRITWPGRVKCSAGRDVLDHPQGHRGSDLAVGDGYDLTLKDGSVVDVSRRQARELRERLAL